MAATPTDTGAGASAGLGEGGLQRTDTDTDIAVRIKDRLGVREDVELRDTLRVWKLMAKNRDNFYGLDPRKLKERIYLTVDIEKVNRKGKVQRRALIITNLALYNFKIDDYSNFKRRIAIADLGAFWRVGGSPTEFVLRAWEHSFDYDYRYKAHSSEDVEAVVEVLQDNFKRLVDEELPVETVAADKVAELIQLKATTNTRRKEAGDAAEAAIEARHDKVRESLAEHLVAAPKLGVLLADNLLDEMIEEGDSDEESSGESGDEPDVDEVALEARFRAHTRVTAPETDEDSDSEDDVSDMAKVAPTGGAAGGDGGDAGAAGDGGGGAGAGAGAGSGATKAPRKRRSAGAKQRRATGFVPGVTTSGKSVGMASSGSISEGGDGDGGGDGAAEVWSARKDPTTGRVYYVNRKTRVSAWVLPEGATLEEVPAAAAASAAADAGAGDDGGGDDANAEAGAEASGDASAEEGTAAGEDDGDADATEAATAAAGGDDSNSFVAYTDPSSGATYYVNKATKESVWELPDGGVVVPN